MSEQAPCAATRPGSSPELGAHLLDVAGHDVDQTLDDLEQLVTRLRADVRAAAAARDELRHFSADVLHEAIRLRAIRAQHLARRTSATGGVRSAAGGASGGRLEARTDIPADIPADIAADIAADVAADVPAGVWAQSDHVEVDAAGSNQ